MKKVTIYTDGACSGNPGPGGWGAILMYGEHKLEISGGEAHTTNNRMELTGPICALSKLNTPCEVELYSDSSYLINAFIKGWLVNWQRRNWIKSDKKPVENQAQDFARQQNQSQAMATEMYFKSAREVSGSQTKNSSVEPAVNTSNVSPILNSPIPAGSALSKEGLYKGNKNEDILRLHKEGKSDVEIAKELNCGLGEVKLVLGLYKGDNNSEI